MTIKTKFDIDDKVLITEIDKHGVIQNIFVGGSDKRIQYNVRYFHEYDAKTCYFFENELQAAGKETSALGFKN